MCVWDCVFQFVRCIFMRCYKIILSIVQREQLQKEKEGLKMEVKVLKQQV